MRYYTSPGIIRLTHASGSICSYTDNVPRIKELFENRSRDLNSEHDVAGRIFSPYVQSCVTLILLRYLAGCLSLFKVVHLPLFTSVYSHSRFTGDGQTARPTVIDELSRRASSLNNASSLPSDCSHSEPRINILAILRQCVDRRRRCFRRGKQIGIINCMREM